MISQLRNRSHYLWPHWKLTGTVFYWLTVARSQRSLDSKRLNMFYCREGRDYEDYACDLGSAKLNTTSKLQSSIQRFFIF